MNVTKPTWTFGIARRKITPPPGVELAGLGYYLNRQWERIRDDLNATALVIGDDANCCVAIIALDLMYNSAALTAEIRSQITAATGIPGHAICVNCSHTHSAPTAGFIRGAGEVNQSYVRLVAGEAATAAIDAFQKRQPARLRVGSGELPGMTFNRTRPNGPVDIRVSVLRADSPAGQPIAIAVNFHSHCTAHMESDLRAISRKWPVDLVDKL